MRSKDGHPQSPSTPCFPQSVPADNHIRLPRVPTVTLPPSTDLQSLYHQVANVTPQPRLYRCLVSARPGPQIDPPPVQIPGLCITRYPEWPPQYRSLVSISPGTQYRASPHYKSPVSASSLLTWAVMIKEKKTHLCCCCLKAGDVSRWNYLAHKLRGLSWTGLIIC